MARRKKVLSEEEIFFNELVQCASSLFRKGYSPPNAAFLAVAAKEEEIAPELRRPIWLQICAVIGKHGGHTAHTNRRKQQLREYIAEIQPTLFPTQA